MFLIQSNFGDKGNFELVVNEKSRLTHIWRDNAERAIFPWYRSTVMARNASSQPALIQSTYGTQGNFELLFREGSRLRHYWRGNDTNGLPWKQGVLFGSKVGSAPAMIQSTFGNVGNFEVVVKEGTQLRHYWRDNDHPNKPWHRGVLFGKGVSSAPALIQSNYGYVGNFEVVVREGSRLRHYWRDNDHPDKPWHQGNLFGKNATLDPAFIQGNFGYAGNFEVLYVENERLRHYWRDNNGPQFPWKAGVRFSDHVTCSPSLIQGNFGRKGNFEVVTRRGDCWVHFWRNNDSSGLSWSDEILLHTTPPIGAAPTAAQRSTFLNYFPNLRNWKVTAPASSHYNCISWTVGVTDNWLWPGSSTTAFDAFYASYGWVPSANGNREYKKRKIALWADTSGCTHGSLQFSTCDWHESKCGSLERIMHHKHQLEHGSYGTIIKYYEKYDASANPDLA